MIWWSRRLLAVACVLLADAAAPRANLRPAPAPHAHATRPLPPALHATQAHTRSRAPRCGDATRRGALAALALAPATARAAALTDQNAPVTRPAAGRFFGEAILPPVPFGRATYRYDLGRGAYAFEQLLRFSNVSATIRMNVQRLKNGKLWVVAPVAPTGECLSLLQELGEVEHLVLPVTALEHKAFFGPFARRFPDATVWAAPGQYGPFGSLGFEPSSSTLPFRVDGVLPRSPKDPQPPWAAEIATKTFYVDLPGNAGPVCEAAFFHKASKTLFVTDAISYIPRLDRAPDIFRTSFPDKVYDDPGFWPKSVLQAVFLTLRQEGKRWPGYESITNRVVRAPILAAFADIRAPAETKAWIQDVTAWPFERVVAAHFASPFRCTPAEVRAAFAQNPNHLDARDWRQLDELNTVIVANDLGAPVRGDYH